MTDLSDLIVPGVLLIGGYIAISRLLNQANQAGAWVGENIIQPAQQLAMYPTTSWIGALEGYPAPTIPATPPGYRPSNWSWDLGGGVVAGLPAGMTPGQFCQQSPTSPMCEQVRAKPSILSEWSNLVW